MARSIGQFSELGVGPFTGELFQLPTNQLPTTVTQRQPFAGILEWAVGHVPQMIHQTTISMTTGLNENPPFFTSPVFVSHGQAWSLVLFPNGTTRTDHDYLSLYLIIHKPPISSTAPNTPVTERVTIVSSHPSITSTSNSTSTPASTTITPFACTHATATGRLSLTPEFQITLIHPSGDPARDYVIESPNIPTSLETPFSLSSDSPSTASYGVPRFISHHQLLSHEFIDSDGSIFIRCEMKECANYQWNFTPKETFPTNATTSTASSGSRSSTSRIPIPTSSSIPPPPFLPSGSAISRTHRSSTSQTSTSSMPVTNAVGLRTTTTLPSTPSYYSIPQLLATSSAPSTTTVESYVTSSHLMFGGYEFYLRFQSTHFMSQFHPLGQTSSGGGNNPTTFFKFKDINSISLVLHPRHYYRLREDITLRVEIELQFSASENSSQVATRHQQQPKQTTQLHPLISRHLAGSFHATTPELVWSSLTQPLQSSSSHSSRHHHSTTSHHTSSDVYISPSTLSWLNTAASLHLSARFSNLGFVWSLLDFPSLPSSRKTSPMFRLHDFTWCLILDPKGNGSPGYLSIYLALDKTSSGVFCHGISLHPVFTLALLHPTDERQHLVRRFEDAIFSYERSSWGCTAFIELDALHQGGWISSPSSGSQVKVEVQIQSAKVVRPPELEVKTKIGPDVKVRNNNTTAMTVSAAAATLQTKLAHQDEAPELQWEEADQFQQQSSIPPSATKKRSKKKKSGSLPQIDDRSGRSCMDQMMVQGDSCLKSRLYVTPSSPAQGPKHQSMTPSSTPFPALQPPPITNSSRNVISVSRSSRSHSQLQTRLSPQQQQVQIDRALNPSPRHLTSPHSLSSVSSSPLSALSSSSSNSSISSYSNTSVASSSPSVTPMVEYLGQEMDEESDSYSLNVQLRRFGVNSTATQTGLNGQFNSDGRSNTAFMFTNGQSSQDSMPISPPPLSLPPSLHTAVTSYPFAINHQHPLTSTTRHGYVCVIRNSQFTDPKLPQLIGYEVDEDRLMNTFLHALHCDLETHLNIPGVEMQRVFKTLATKDYSSYDYLMIFILTHGVDSNTVYAADGTHLPVNEVFCMFRGVECKSLIGKPKLFFVQACRGSAVDYSNREGSGIPNLNPPPASSSTTTPPSTTTTTTNNTTTSVLAPITITRSPQCGSLPLGYSDVPNECDFLYASSCVPGYISWTNTASGSWYITALCNVLLSYWPTMHLGDILLRVNYAVSKQNKLVEKYGSVYQIAAPAFTLTKRLFFTLHGVRHSNAISRVPSLPSAASLASSTSIAPAVEPEEEDTPMHEVTTTDQSTNG